MEVKHEYFFYTPVCLAQFGDFPDEIYLTH